MSATFIVTIGSGATGGSWGLVVNGTPVTGITFGVTGATVQTDINAVMGANYASVTGAAGGPYTVTLSVGGTLGGNPVGLTPSGTVWVTNPDGSMTWQGSVTIPPGGGADFQNTGVCTATYTPWGGVANIPALLDGPPGLPPQLTFSAVPVPVGAGNVPGAPTVTSTQTEPGGPGTPSAYSVEIGVPTGSTGQQGPTATISTASDVEGTPAGNNTLLYNSTDNKWKIQAQWLAQQFNSTSFTAASGSGAGASTVATIGVPALPFAWRPEVSAQMAVLGTTNTHLDLLATLNTTTGAQVGYGLGITGAANVVTMIPNYGVALSPGPTAVVAAGATATIFLQVVQTASTTDSWSSTTGKAGFTVKAVPLQ